MKKIAICGGHLSPALALIEQLRKEKDIEIFFFGRKFATEGSANTSAEFKEISKINIKFVSLTAGRLSRRLNFHALSSFLKIPVGFIQSLYYLVKFRPKLIVSFGGYLSFPVVFGGWLLGIGSICHEQPQKPGLANRLNSLFAIKVFTSWTESKNYFPKNKTRVIGNLTRQDLYNTKTQNSKIAAFLNSNRDYVVVTGGNQGSHFINNLIFNNYTRLSQFAIFHILGTANYKDDHQKAKNIRSKNYFSCDFVESTDIGAVFHNAKFIVGRSGANTVWDLAVLGKPAVFIPLPHGASNEQFENARVLLNAGSAKIYQQKELSGANFVRALEDFEKNIKTYQKNANIFKNTLSSKAAQILKSEIRSLI